MKHLLTWKDYAAGDIVTIIERAIEGKRRPERYARRLEGRNLLMLFQKTSTRTRLSFEIGMQELGGRAVFMEWSKSNFSISPSRYEARYVSRHVDLIMARLVRHEDVVTLSESAGVPVINGCCNRYHPTQALADLMTVYERTGRFDGITLAYVGVHNNVANSLAAAGTKVGLRVVLVTPEVNPSSWDEELMRAAEKTGRLTVTHDIGAVKEADFVYTDTWIDMEFFDDPSYADEKERRISLMSPYQVRPEILGETGPFIMHDMPIHPGYEIDESLIDSPRSVIFEQAENRMHAEKSLMLYLLDRY